MTLHESIDNLFKHINSISLKESTLSRDIFKYSSKSKRELRSLVRGAENCIRSFSAKYSFETRDTISDRKKFTYYDDYHGCITYLTLLLAMYGGHSYDTYSAIFQTLDQLNRISDRIFPRAYGVFVTAEDMLKLAKNFRKSNADLHSIFREHKLSQFDTSKITDKSISEYGLNEAKLIDASFGKNSITIQFEVESTGDNTHVDLTGKTQVFLKRGYSVTIQFTNTDNYLSPTNINKNAIAQQFNSVIQNCDAKVYCDCPAFYWQGMAEKDAKQGDSYFGFRGQHGTGYWNNLHNVNGPQACKHIWSAIYFVNTEQKQICDKLASKVVNSTNVYDNIISQH
jgi:hypothetical protein